VSFPRTVLVTRPVEDAGPLAQRIEALGHRTIVEPLLTIRFLGARIDLSGVQALAFTSANGVRALKAALGDGVPATMPVFAVGRATAKAARDAGFEKVTAAAGDVESLAARIGEDVQASGGAILHIAGRDRAGDLAAALARQGFEARRVVLYAADAASELTAGTVTALRKGAVDDVVIFSPRTARQFVTLVGDAGLRSDMRRVRLLAFSPRVADAAKELSFASVAVAARTDEDALVALLSGETNEDESPSMSAETPPAEADEKPASPPARPRGRTGLVLLLAFLTLVIAAGVVAALDPGLRARIQGFLPGAAETAAPAPSPEMQRLDALAARIGALGGDIASLKSEVAGLPRQAGADPARLDELARKLDGLAERIARLESGLAERPAKAIADADALALLGLIAALDAGRPFDVYLQAGRRALVATGAGSAQRLAALDAVAPRAARGIPTAAMLALRAGTLKLQSPAPEKPVPAASAAAPPPAGLWDRIVARLSGLVTVRRIGDSTSSATLRDDPLDAVVQNFAAGDVTAALAGLRAIDRAALAPASADGLAALIADAEARLLASRMASGPLAAGQ
jgi:uroporphyrinogen-III synthase